MEQHPDSAFSAGLLLLTLGHLARTRVDKIIQTKRIEQGPGRVGPGNGAAHRSVLGFLESFGSCHPLKPAPRHRATRTMGSAPIRTSTITGSSRRNGLERQPCGRRRICWGML
jgi:hypothetical protein